MMLIFFGRVCDLREPYCMAMLHAVGAQETLNDLKRAPGSCPHSAPACWVTESQLWTKFLF